MEKGFSVLGAGSSSVQFSSRVRERYLDRPLSGLKPFPTLFKRSILRRIEGVELIYRRPAHLLTPEMRFLTKHQNENYSLNIINSMNMPLFINFSICSSEGSMMWVVHPPPSSEPFHSIQEIYSYRISDSASNLYKNRLAERVRSSHIGYGLPVAFERGFAAFHDGLKQKCRPIHQRDANSGEADRPIMTTLDGLDRMIVHRLPVALLHEVRESVKDEFTKRAGMGVTRPSFEGTDRPIVASSDGLDRMIVHRLPVALLHEVRESVKDEYPKRAGMGTTRPRFEGADRSVMVPSDEPDRVVALRTPTIIIHEMLSGIFGNDSETVVKLKTIDPAPLIVHGKTPSINKLTSSRGEDSKAVAVPRIPESDFESPSSLEFAEYLTRSSAFSDLKRVYRRYPELEHVEPVQTKIITEREALRENKPEPDLGPRFIDLNLNRISDQVYSMIERRIRIERERRGLYG